MITLYIKEFNNERSLRPYFLNYPLTSKEIHFTFSIKDAKTGRLKVSMLCFNGKIITIFFENGEELKEITDTAETVFEKYFEYKKKHPHENIIKKYKFL